MFSEEYQKLKPYISGFTFDEAPMYTDFDKKEICGYILSSSSILRKNYTIKRIENIIEKGNLNLKIEMVRNKFYENNFKQVEWSVLIATNVKALAMLGNSKLFRPNKSTVNEQKDKIYDSKLNREFSAGTGAE